MHRNRRRPGKLRALSALVAVSLGLAAACGDDDSATTGAPSETTAQGAPEEPTRGGKIEFGHMLSPTGLDPVNSNGASNASGDGPYFQALYDMLLMVDDETGQVRPRTAKSMTTTDGLVWTLELNDGIRFTDGTPYDAEAVKFNWERIADPANRSPNMGVAQSIASMEVVSPLTLRVTLKQPNMQFNRNVANQLPFVGSPTAIRAAGARSSEIAVGAGPFVLENWVRDSAVTMRRNPDYWIEGRPYVDGLVIRYLSDPVQRYNAFETGQTNITYVASVYDMVTRAEQAGEHVERIEIPGALTLMFNTAKPPFDDVVARRAVDAALDRARFNDTVDQGNLPPAKNLYPPSHPFHDPTATLGSYDKQRAQQLFDQYAAAHGGPLSFTISSAETQRPAMEFIQAQFTEFRNVEVRVDIIEPTTVVQQALAGNFEATFFTMNWIDPEPDVTNFLSSRGGRNYMKYSNPEMDAAINAGRSSLDLRQRAEAYKTVQNRLIQDVPLVFLRPLVYFHLLDEDVQNFTHSNSGLPTWSEIWVKGGDR